MGTRKNLTIGITVNLEHYENLRLEVGGEVESREEAEELARFLDDILGRFGREDPATAERVDSYRKRVFPPVTDTGTRRKTGGTGEFQPPVDTREEQPVSPPRNAPAPPPAAEPTSLPSSSSPSGETGKSLTCEMCSGSVTPAEQKMSQLFTSRTLCRACLKKL